MTQPQKELHDWINYKEFRKKNRFPCKFTNAKNYKSYRRQFFRFYYGRRFRLFRLDF